MFNCKCFQMKICLILLYQALASEPMQPLDLRRELQSIEAENPTWSRSRISIEFARRFPNQPDPPGGDKVARLLMHSVVEDKRDTSNWDNLTRNIKREKTRLVKSIMETVVATAPPETTRREIIKKTVDDYNLRSGGINFPASKMVGIYEKLRKQSGQRLTCKEKASKVFEIVDAHPEWTHGEIAIEFMRLNPSESISRSSVAKYLHYRHLRGTTERDNYDWLRLNKEEKHRASREAVKIMQRLVEASPKEDTGILVARGVKEMFEKFNLRIQPATMYKHYSTVMNSL